MDLSRPLSVVTPTVDGDVLCFLALADAWFTTGRLHHALGRYSVDGVRRTLRRLEEQGIVETQAAGPATLYRLNRQHLAAGPIIALANLRRTLIERLVDHFIDWPVRPRLAALFGSAARGDMRTDSDIDLFLIRPAGVDADGTWATLGSALEAEVSRWTGNDTRVLELSEEHVLRHAGGEPVLRDVYNDGVGLVGELEWLGRLLRLQGVRA